MVAKAIVTVKPGALDQLSTLLSFFTDYIVKLTSVA